MSVDKTAPAKADPIASSKAIVREDNPDSSDTYQKVLDYHVAEILLSTIVLAVITLLRLHH
jgi:hypothetical protein